MAAIFLYVADPALPDATFDVPIRDHLVNDLGHTVTYKVDTDTDISGADALVVSESVGSSNTAWMQDDVIGILTVEGSQWDELDMGSGGASSGPAEDTWDILDNTHFITSEESTGALVVRTTTDTNGSGNMTGAASGKNLADWDVAGSHGLVAYETGDTLVSGSPSSTAPDRRVFMGFRQYGDVNTAGERLFDRGITWILHEEAVERQLAETVSITDESRYETFLHRYGDDNQAVLDALEIETIIRAPGIQVVHIKRFTF